MMQEIEGLAVDFLAFVYLVAGSANLIGGAFVRRLFNQWQYPGQFHRVVGALELLSAAFLASPETRILGLVMAGVIGFFSVVTLLNHRQYAWSIPAILIFAAVAPAALMQG
jgi:predicted MFS family arabinose efflux permease